MRRPNYDRNFQYELWLATVHGAPASVIAELRRLEAEEEAALARDKGEPEPPKPKRRSKPKPRNWLKQITPGMVDRANRRPAASHASRADLLGPSQSISLSDRFGDHITTFEDLTSRGFKR